MRIEAIDQRAAEAGMTRSAYMVQAVVGRGLYKKVSGRRENRK